jgi:hypothetical protein
MGGVFISYRRRDSQGFAGRLEEGLVERFGDAKVFRDVEIRPGDDYTVALREAVAVCDVLLAVISHGWLHARTLAGTRRLNQPDDWVRVEIETALDRGVRVIPVLVGGAEMPPADQLPASLAPLASRQAFVLADRRDGQWVEDMDRLGALLAETVAPLDAAPETAGPVRDITWEFPRRRSRSTPWLGRLGKRLLEKLAVLLRQALGFGALLAVAYYVVLQVGSPSAKHTVNRLVQPLLDWIGSL